MLMELLNFSPNDVVCFSSDDVKAANEFIELWDKMTRKRCAQLVFLRRIVRSKQQFTNVMQQGKKLRSNLTSILAHKCVCVIVCGQAEAIFKLNKRKQTKLICDCFI